MMPECMLCLKQIDGEHVSVKKIGTKGEKPEDYRFAHIECWREVK